MKFSFAFHRLQAAILSCAFVLAAGRANSGEADPVRVLDAKMYHLGTPGLAEWQEFEGKEPHGRRLDLKFQAQENADACTLFMRQDNVKFSWAVLINGKKIGELAPMDALQVNALAVPAGALKNGENTLSIVPPIAIDDIFAGDFRLDDRPREKALSQSRLVVKVTDKQTKAGLPCRITVADPNGALMPLIVLDPVVGTLSPDKSHQAQSSPGLRVPTTTPEANDPSRLLAARTGVVYTRDGVATIGVQPGEYTVYATRGFEYSMGTRQVSVAAGQSQAVALQIEREVPTPGLVACDTHIHTLTFSGHGDARIDERMLTIAGEGIEVAVSTEHNHHADYSGPQTRAGLGDLFTFIMGNEVTTKAGHFNAFPVSPGSTPPDAKITDWPVLIQAMRATVGVHVITLNHPRDLHTNFIPFGPQNFNAVSGEHHLLPPLIPPLGKGGILGGSDLGFDAVEVVTSAALQSDIQRLYQDWFALLNHGYRVAGIASSDSHDVSRFILGQGRTYAACDDSRPGAINIEQLCRSFREGRVAASMGLLADARVEERFAPGDLATGLGEQIRVTATVLGPSWISADRVELFANGFKIEEQRIEPAAAIEKARVTWTLRRPAQDTHLVVVATGPGVSAPCWAIPRPYQPASKVWTPRVVGSTNPIWLDADGDGKFTAPRALAAQLLAQAGNDPARLLPLLSKYDRAVAAQAASLCHAANLDLKAGAFQALLKSAPEHIQAAFADFLASLELRKAVKPEPKK